MVIARSASRWRTHVGASLLFGQASPGPAGRGCGAHPPVGPRSPRWNARGAQCNASVLRDALSGQRLIQRVMLWRIQLALSGSTDLQPDEQVSGRPHGRLYACAHRNCSPACWGCGAKATPRQPASCRTPDRSATAGDRSPCEWSGGRRRRPQVRCMRTGLLASQCVPGTSPGQAPAPGLLNQLWESFAERRGSSAA